jgi:hypothetical protein
MDFKQGIIDNRMAIILCPLSKAEATIMETKTGPIGSSAADALALLNVLSLSCLSSNPSWFPTNPLQCSTTSTWFLKR